MYGRGASSIAEQIGKTTEEAQAIIDSFYKGFPKVKIWVDKTQAEVKQKGYVETLWGRRRRLPDVNLPPYTVKPLKNKTLFNPFIDCVDKANQELIDNIHKYEKLALNIRNAREYQRLKDSAALENININSNVGFIKQAERQSINARVQGGSADITKRAMISIYNDKEMRELGFKILLCIHDEIVGECPEENAEKVASRLSYLMMEAPKPNCMIPFKCDSSITNCWYEEEYATWIKEDFEEMGKDFQKLQVKHPERFLDELKDILKRE